MLVVRTPDEMVAQLPKALAGETTLLPVPPEADPIGVDLDTGAAVVITTSGSTGRPKLVALSAEALLASAAATREHLGEAMDWVSPLPFQYVASVMTQVRAHEADMQAIRCRADLADLAAPQRPTAISLVPTQLRRAMTDPLLRTRLAQHHTVLLGGAAADRALVAGARASGIPVVTTYGMSETCGGCVYDGVPLPGVEVSLEHPELGPGASSSCGRIWLSGPMLFDGYLGDHLLTAQTLIGSRLRTHDRGSWDEHTGTLAVWGRIDEVIISGGVNIDLAELNRALDAVSSGRAIAVGAPHPDWGTAVVVYSEDDSATADELLASYRARLSRAGITRVALPKLVVPTVGLPRLPSGKIDRQALLARSSGLFQED